MSKEVTMERNVGRLIEIRVPRMVTADLLQVAFRRYEKLVSLGDQRVLMCTDERQLQVHSPEAAELLLGVWKKRDPRIRRNAILVRPKAIIQLQVRRMIDRSGNPDRKMFQEASELREWLGADMTPDERDRLWKFIEEGNLGPTDSAPDD